MIRFEDNSRSVELIGGNDDDIDLEQAFLFLTFSSINVCTFIVDLCNSC